MEREKETTQNPRTINEFSEILPNFTLESGTEVIHIENLANMLGMTTMIDVVPPFLEHERKINEEEKIFQPESSLTAIEKNLTAENALSLSRQIMSNLIVHYAFLHNESFRVPSSVPFHAGQLPPSENVQWSNDSYLFTRVREKERYEASVALLLTSLKKAMPKAMEIIIKAEIEDLEDGV